MGPPTSRVFCRSAPGSGHSPGLAALSFALLGDAASAPVTVIMLAATATVTPATSNPRSPRLAALYPTWATISPPDERCWLAWQHPVTIAKDATVVIAANTQISLQAVAASAGG